MSQSIPSSQIRELADRLLAYETAGNAPSSATLPPGFRVVEKLRRSLNRLAGGAGFHALLGRALTLAKAQTPTLSAVQLTSNGSIEGFHEWSVAEAAEAEATLIAQLLGLLVTFVGESLMLRLLQDVWPDLSFQKAKAGEQNQHDPT